jgi:predicted nuclease of predicted toxin-antitoxin system
MKLLFDQNVSPRLARLLADIYPDSLHIREVGLRDAGDTESGNTPS